MQSADAEYVVTIAAVATMMLPVKGIVQDITVDSSTEAVDMHVVSAVRVHVDANHGQHFLSAEALEARTRMQAVLPRISIAQDS